MIRKICNALSVLAVSGTTGYASVSNEPLKEMPLETENIISRPPPLGQWIGLLDVGSLKVTLAFDLSEGPNNGIIAKVACPEQGISDFPVDVTWQDGTLRLEMKKLGATYEGLFNQARTEIHGQFKQNGGVFPLILKKEEKKIALTLPLRPQEPKPPIPYEQEEVNFPNPLAKVTLAGTLTLPRSEKPVPAVLLIAGSGPNDRNESVFGHKPFLVLADHLTRQGIAVLRVDKRGVGASTGNYETSTSEDFADDVLAGIEYLKTRKEINPHQIGLIGHSEGGVIAPIVAAQSKDIAFIVLMAAPGVNGEEILQEQGALISRSMGVTDEEIARQLDFQKQMFAVVKKENNLEIAEKRLREIVAEQFATMPEEQKKASVEAMEAQIKRCNSKWFRYFLTHDPVETLKRVKIPVLALNGELDSQVSLTQNLPVIAKALQDGGNQDYSIIELPKLNHMFQTSETGAIAEYGNIEETIAPVALNKVASWIVDRTIHKKESGLHSNRILIKA